MKQKYYMRFWNIAKKKYELVEVDEDCNPLHNPEDYKIEIVRPTPSAPKSVGSTKSQCK